MQPPDNSWVEHMDILVPLFKKAMDTLAWVLGLGLTFLGLVIGYIGRDFKKRFEAMEHRLEVLHYVMLSCEGCAETVKEYRRKEDRTSNDGSDF